MRTWTVQSVAAAGCRQEGWSSQLSLLLRSSGTSAHSLVGEQRRWVPACDAIQSDRFPSFSSSVLVIQLSMLVPFQWTALKTFVWTVSALPLARPLRPGVSSARCP